MGRSSPPSIDQFDYTLPSSNELDFLAPPAPLYIISIFTCSVWAGALFDQWERGDVLFHKRSSLEAYASAALVYAVHRSNSLPCSIGHLKIYR
jgi:hypothetical protein